MCRNQRVWMCLMEYFSCFFISKAKRFWVPAEFPCPSCFSKEKVRSVEGTAVIRDSREPAKLGVSFSYCESDSSPPVPFHQPSIHASLSLFFLVTPYAPYWVLTTDYTSLSVVYSCTSFLHLFHIDYAWILSRSPKPSPSTVRYAKQLLVREGIDISRMKATVQNCWDSPEPSSPTCCLQLPAR